MAASRRHGTASIRLGPLPIVAMETERLHCAFDAISTQQGHARSPPSPEKLCRDFPPPQQQTHLVISAASLRRDVTVGDDAKNRHGAGETDIDHDLGRLSADPDDNLLENKRWGGEKYI